MAKEEKEIAEKEEQLWGRIIGNEVSSHSHP